MKDEVFGILGLIAIRKGDLFGRVIELLSNKNLSEEDKNKIKNYISEMQNIRFLSEEEIKNKNIKIDTTFDDLGFNLEEIQKEIENHVLKK